VIAIAELLGIREPVCSALVGLYGEERVDQVEWAKQTLLRDCRTVFNGYTTIPISYLLAWLHAIEGSPWKGWYSRGFDANDPARDPSRLRRTPHEDPVKGRRRCESGLRRL
jgi:hypothetical protein